MVSNITYKTVQYFIKKCRTNLSNIYQKTIAKINQISYNINIEKVLQISNYKIIPQLDQEDVMESKIKNKKERYKWKY